ncbi:ATP-binding protein [Chloroflexota bacterium]
MKKELSCIHNITDAGSARDMPIHKHYEEIVNMLPRVWQFPEITCARIAINNSEFKTENYQRTKWQQSSDIKIYGARAGTVEVGYLEGKPEIDEGPFSREERLIIDTVAERLGILAEYRQAKEVLKAVSHNSPLGIYIIQDNKLQYTNPQFQKFTECSEKELMDMELWSLVAAEDMDVVKSSIVHSLKQKRAYPCEYRIISKTGQIKWVMQTVSAIQYQGREAILGNLMDITERKYLERKVIEYEELSKLKSNLLATVSHELRTPLATIKGYSTLIVDYFHKLSTEEKKDYLKCVDNATDRLTKLVDNLLDTSRMEAGLLKLHKKPNSITALINKVAAEARIRAINHHIIIKPVDKLPRINIDAKRIQQVLDNLIDNAKKFSPPGTEICISSRRADQEIVISVADQGPGIPADELTKVFERMYRIEQRLTPGVDGIGLGLSICRRLVETHGGQIWAESEPMKGVTFHFSLPISNQNKKTILERGKSMDKIYCYQA